jgi:CheY-like chemotaxis protein
MKKVMIIEDDPAIRDVLGLMFTRAGYTVSKHENGNFLLQSTFDIPDLFIIDKQLSGVDGLDLCKHLKSRPPTRHLPVIILSATPYLQRQAGEAGANAFVEKPFSNNDLLQIASTLINNG